MSITLACAGDWPEQPAINAATRLAAKPQVSSASDHSEQASLASLDSADAQEVRAKLVHDGLPPSPCILAVERGWSRNPCPPVLPLSCERLVANHIMAGPRRIASLISGACV